MNRADKAAQIEDIKASFAKAQLTILADYKGLPVSQLTDLRTKLNETESKFKVVKKRLAKIAIKDTTAEILTDHFTGTTAITTTEGDPTGPAKVLAEFAKKNDKLVIRVGFFADKELDLDAIKNLASLPSKEVLIGRLMGSMQAPATNLVSVLSQIPRQLVTVLQAVKDQKEQSV